MADTPSTIKVIVCVPYVRTFQVIVRTDQKIDVIKRAFPNLNNQSNLIYWFEGAQLIPNLTFGEVGIQDYSSIIISVQTDVVAFNNFFISISKYANEKRVADRMIQKFTQKDDGHCLISHKIIPKRLDYQKEERKYFFTQKLKQLFHNCNFSKTENKSFFKEDQFSSFSPMPLPVMN